MIGRHGMAWLGVARRVKERNGTARQARQGVDRSVMAGSGKAGTECHGLARSGSARQGRLGAARPVAERGGGARQEWHGMAWKDQVSR